MDITISFRHIDADEEIKVYIEEKMARLQKYIETPLDVHVVLSLERKYRHRVDVMFTVNGVVINAHEVMDDTRAAVDKILDKLERRLTKYRDKLKKYREAKTKRCRQERRTGGIKYYHSKDTGREAHGPGRGNHAASCLRRQLHNIP